MKLYKAQQTPDYLEICMCLQSLDDAKAVSECLETLIRGNSDQSLMAYQVQICNITFVRIQIRKQYNIRRLHSNSVRMTTSLSQPPFSRAYPRPFQVNLKRLRVPRVMLLLPLPLSQRLRQRLKKMPQCRRAHLTVTFFNNQTWTKTTDLLISSPNLHDPR